MTSITHLSKRVAFPCELPSEMIEYSFRLCGGFYEVYHARVKCATTGEFMFVRAIKRIAALVLLASWFMPLAQCTTPTPAAEGKDDRKVVSRTIEISVAPDLSSPRLEDAGLALVFGWAMLIQLLLLLKPQFEFRRSLFAIELLCSALTLLYIGGVVSTFGTTLRYGAIVAYAAVSAYVLASFAGRRSRARVAGTTTQKA